MASDLVETGWRLMVASCCTDVCSFSNGCGCAERIAAALAEQSRLNEEAYRRGVEHERARITQRERRRVVTWLHERANSMNDPRAKAVLNSAAFDLGLDNAAIRARPADREGTPDT